MKISEKLFTEKLEEQFGPGIDVEIIDQNRDLRRSYLMDSNNIPRAYAITRYGQNVSDLSEVDREIRNGGAIGRTFKQAGYSVDKNYILDKKVRLPEWLKRAFRTDANTARVRAYELIVSKDDFSANYAVITEIYSPGVRL